MVNHFVAEGSNANVVASYPAPRREFIEVDQPGSEFVVETDVSFPVEIQSDTAALADQQTKTQSTPRAEGVLTAEEHAVAKTKPLS